MKILKFGGSSLSTPATIRGVGRILLEARRREPVIGVVSAFQGITNQLLECARLAERADAAYLDLLDQIAKRHRAAVSHLVGRRPARVRAQVDELLAELASTLQGIHLLRHCPLRALDMTASFGERLSAVIVSAYLGKTNPSAFVDARDLIVTDDQFTHANVIFRKTNRRTRAYFDTLFKRARTVVPIVGGPSGTGLDKPRALVDLAAELGLADVVRFVPPVSQTELAQWYAAATVVAVPSYNESFGLVAVEAEATGTPVVAAAVGGLTTAVREGHSGLLVPGHDTDEWADALRRVLSDDALRTRLEAGARQQAALFSWDATADATLEVYDRASASLATTVA